MTAEETQAKRRRDEAALLLLLLLGASLGWTLADIRRIATVGPQQIQDARKLWRDLMAGAASGFIDGIGWDAEQQTYNDLTPAQLKQTTLDFTEGVAGKITQATAPLVAGDLTIEEWQRTVGRYVRSAFTAVAAIAAGGVGRMLPADTAATSQALRFSLGRLERFAKQAEHQDASAGTADVIMNRVTLYAAAGNGLFEKVRRISHIRAANGAGKRLFLKERNRLRPADHCHTSPNLPGCVEETLRGWVPIGVLSLPTQRTCLVNCKCFLEFEFR